MQDLKLFSGSATLCMYRTKIMCGANGRGGGVGWDVKVELCGTCDVEHEDGSIWVSERRCEALLRRNVNGESQ